MFILDSKAIFTSLQIFLKSTSQTNHAGTYSFQIVQAYCYKTVQQISVMKFKVKAFSLLALYLYRIGQVFQLQQRIVLCYQPIQLHLFNKEHHS